MWDGWDEAWRRMAIGEVAPASDVARKVVHMGGASPRQGPEVPTLAGAPCNNNGRVLGDDADWEPAFHDDPRLQGQLLANFHRMERKRKLEERY